MMPFPVTLPLKLTYTKRSEEEMQRAKCFIYGGALWTVPELLFECKKFISALQQLLTVG
jgi:hypothetical protein